MHLFEYRGGCKLSRSKVRCLSAMQPSPRRSGNCVNTKVRSTHPLNILGGLQLSGKLRHAIRRCSSETIKDSVQTRDKRLKLPPTPKSLGRCIQEPNPSLKLLRLLRFL